jgi:hypothetical protein
VHEDGVLAAFSRPLLVPSFSLCDFRLFVIKHIVSLKMNRSSQPAGLDGHVRARPQSPRMRSCAGAFLGFLASALFGLLTFLLFSSLLENAL